MTFSRFSFVALAAAGLLAATGASAQVRTWNFGDTTQPGACTGTYGTYTTVVYGNTISCTEQPGGTVTNLQVTAWSSDGTNSAFRTASVNQQGTGSGFGAFNQTEGGAGSPNHAVDNITPGGSDALLLNFTGGLSAQILKTVTLGWSGTDGDFQVLRWGGSGAVTTLAGATAASLLSSGWQLVSTVDGAGNISTPDVTYNVNGTNLASSTWLITAFNGAFGGALSAGNDAIKVLGITTGLPTTPPTGVSTPGSLALAGLGLLGLAAFRRRQRG